MVTNHYRLGFPCLTIFLRNFYFGVLSVSLITQCDFWGDPIYPRTCSRVYVYFIEVLLIIFAWIKRKIIPKPQIKIILHFTSVFLSVCWLGFIKLSLFLCVIPGKHFPRNTCKSCIGIITHTDTDDWYIGTKVWRLDERKLF